MKENGGGRTKQEDNLGSESLIEQRENTIFDSSSKIESVMSEVKMVSPKAHDNQKKSRHFQDVSAGVSDVSWSSGGLILETVRRVRGLGQDALRVSQTRERRMVIFKHLCDTKCISVRLSRVLPSVFRVRKGSSTRIWTKRVGQPAETHLTHLPTSNTSKC